MLRSVIAAVFIGVLGGVWVALVSDDIEIFQNYAEGVWRYQVGVRSFAAPIVGLVIGALGGANIRLALAPDRSDGFVRGALVGLAVGGMLVLAQIVLVALAASFGDYRVPYQSLLTRFSGIIFVAAVIGAAAGLLKAERPVAAPIPGAVAGALIAAAFVLPNVATNVLTITTSDLIEPSELYFFATLVLASHASSLLAGAGGGAIIGVVYEWKGLGESDARLTAISVLLGTLTAVTASSPSFHYVVFGLLPSESSFSLSLYVFRVLVGLLSGVAVGTAVVSVGRRVISTRHADADMIDTNKPND